MEDLYTKPLAAQRYRALRVQSIRKALHLSRQQFHALFSISIGTLQHWENPTDSCGLSEKGAHTLSDTLRAFHIRVNPEWLLYGIGAKPIIPAKFQTLPSLSAASRDLDSYIEKELRFFYELHAGAIDTVLEDDSMLPVLLPGDHVAGLKCTGTDMALALGKECIVVTGDNEVLVRLVCEGDAPGLYTLKARNFQTKAPKPILYDVIILSAAPVIWIRRILALSKS